jgi:hypothetical protein
MSRSIRKETSSLAFGIVGRFGGSSAGFVVAALNAASAASREVVVLRVLSAGILCPRAGSSALRCCPSTEGGACLPSRCGRALRRRSRCEPTRHSWKIIDFWQSPPVSIAADRGRGRHLSLRTTPSWLRRGSVSGTGFRVSLCGTMRPTEQPRSSFQVGVPTYGA